MDRLSILKKNLPLVFVRFRARLKSQAKIISKFLSISSSSSYELIAALWGYDNWYQMNRFLKEMEQIHSYIRLSEFECFDSNRANRVIVQLRAYDQFVTQFEGGWFSRAFVKGIYTALTAPPSLADAALVKSTDEFDEYLLTVENNYIDLFDSIACKTAWLDNRLVFSEQLVDHFLSMNEYIGQCQRPLSEFNLGSTSLETAWKLHNLIPKLFGVEHKLLSMEQFEDLALSSEGDYLYGALSSNPMNELLIGQSMEHGLKYQLTLKELCDQLELANSEELNVSWEKFASIGIAATHLPNDALVTIVLKSARSPIMLDDITVKKEKDIPALLACTSYHPIKEYKPDSSALIFGGDSQLKEKYIGGVTAYWE